jgi:glycosyltransferase involved in cell wall biosynthesis
MEQRAVAAERVRVVLPGLPKTRFDHHSTGEQARRALGIREGAIVVGTIGRLSRQKRHDVLVHAFSRVKAIIPDAFLAIIGGGELEMETKDLLDGLPTGSCVITGHRADAPDLLPAFDVFAMSSDFEGLPFALLEAMATGRAIVTTDVQGAGEAVRHEREGLLVPRRDPEALATAIVRLARDRALAKKLGEAARQRFLHDFTADQMVERTEALYLEILERSGRR